MGSLSLFFPSPLSQPLIESVTLIPSPSNVFITVSRLLPPPLLSWLHLPSSSFASFTLQHIVRLIFSLPLSCCLCLSIYFTQSYLSLTLSIPPPFFHLSFSGPPSAPLPHLHCHPIDGWCGAASRASIRAAVLWAISKPIPLIAISGCSNMTLQLSPVEQEKESSCSELHSDCRAEWKTFYFVAIREFNWEMY